MNKEKCLVFLIRYLMDENPQNIHCTVPNEYVEKWRFFRMLVNVRPPQKASNEFLSAQDELLQSLIVEKGVTNAESLFPIRDNLCLWRGDITTLKAGAIVNAANSAMLGCFSPNHACIDNAIHTFSGVQLRLECADIMNRQGHPEPTGQAKITGAYNLPSKYILHTVGPIVYDQVTDENRRLLASCYRSCLDVAKQNKIESVAFCCISTGEFRFPNEEAAQIAVATVTDYLKSCDTIKKVIFNVFTEHDERIYRKLLG